MQIYIKHLFNKDSTTFHYNCSIKRHPNKNDGSYKDLDSSRFIMHSQQLRESFGIMFCTHLSGFPAKYNKSYYNTHKHV